MTASVRPERSAEVNVNTQDEPTWLQIRATGNNPIESSPSRRQSIVSALPHKEGLNVGQRSASVFTGVVCEDTQDGPKWLLTAATSKMSVESGSTKLQSISPVLPHGECLNVGQRSARTCVLRL